MTSFAAASADGASTGKRKAGFERGGNDKKQKLRQSTLAFI